MRGFEPVRLFRSAVHAVIILRRIERILAAPRAVPVATLRTTPYSLRPLRKMLDAQVSLETEPEPELVSLSRGRTLRINCLFAQVPFVLFALNVAI